MVCFASSKWVLLFFGKDFADFLCLIPWMGAGWGIICRKGDPVMAQMGLGLKQHVTVKLDQRLVITPQLQQAIKLLQLNHVELAEMLQEELLENPILEEFSSLDELGPQEEQPQAAEASDASEASEATTGEAGAEAPQGAEVAAPGGESSIEAAVADIPAEGEGPGVDDQTLEGLDSMDVDWNAFFEDLDLSKAALPSNKESFDPEISPIEARVSADESLSEHLTWQLHLLRVPDDTLQMALMFIGYLNEDGWLVLEDLPKATGPEILDYLTEFMVLQERLEGEGGGESEEERFAYWRSIADDALDVVQGLEPTGIGARSLEEALLLQCRQHDELKDPALIERLIREHLQDLERRNYPAIAKKIKVALEEIIESAEVLTLFDPRPGRNYTTDPPAYITPDIYIKKVGDEYTVSLNDDGLPKLKISGYYKQAMKNNGNAAGSKEFIQEKLRNATWLLRSIHQRQRTIHKVTESIIKRQRDFLEKGIQYLKPMILRDVADDIEMHESTISRVTTNKYVHTPQGVFELKFFFTSSLQSSRGGDDVSSLTVKEKIKRMINEEDSKSPLSDQQIVENLKKVGVKIARRTVAKYRTQMDIPSSNRRKQPY